ncbi:MAG: hypothetical protein AAB612_04235 [Patescibacteria group bacterium]
MREPLVARIHVPVTIFLKLSIFFRVLPFGTIKMAPIKRILYGLISFIVVMVSIIRDCTPKKQPLIPQKLRYYIQMWMISTQHRAVILLVSQQKI